MAEKTDEHKVLQSKSHTQNASASDTGLQEDGESKGPSDSYKLPGDVIPKKRSTFKITSVTTTHTTPNSRGGSGDLTADVDGDSLDDLDESHTEDFSSEMYDVSSKATDLDQDMLLTPEEIILKEKPSDSQSRFKVVKIETKEPFRRGRWYCHDFLDTVENKAEKQTEEITVHSGNSSAGNSVHYVHGVDDPLKNPLLAGGTGTVPITPNQPITEVPFNLVQTESFVPIHPAPNPSQQQQPISLVGHIQSQQGTPGLPGIDSSSIVPSQVPSNLPAQAAGILPVVQSVGGTQNPPGQSNSSQSVSLSNAQSVPLPHMPQSLNQSEPSSQVTPASGAQTGQINSAMQQGSQFTDQQAFNSQPYSMTNVPIPGQPPQSQGGQANVNTSNLQTNTETVPMAVQNQSAASGSVTSTPSGVSQPPGPTAQQTHLTQPKTQSLSATVSSGNISGMQSTPNPTAGESIKKTGTNASSSARRASMDCYAGIRTTVELQNLVQETSGSIPELSGPLLSAVSGREGPAKETKDDSESGASAVAIDNKIEQAMDLVKSHLMFAVREEVEVLKEQIKELVEKIGQLEYENTILRAAATPETLAKLQPQKALPPSSTS